MTAEKPWTSEAGEGDAVLLLHPGGTDSRSMMPLGTELVGYRRVFMDRPGHGHSHDTDEVWTFESMADAAATVIADRSDAPVHVVGWSDGAIVGIHLALRHPDLVRSLVFGGAVFDRSGWLDGVLDGEPPEFMRDAYGEISPDGVDHWPVVVRKSRDQHEREPVITVEQLRHMLTPTLIVVGDDDEVRWDHLIAMYEAVPNAELAVVPRATHGLIIEKPRLFARLIRDFHDPAATNGLAPIRRAGRSR